MLNCLTSIGGKINAKQWQTPPRRAGAHRQKVGADSGPVDAKRPTGARRRAPASYFGLGSRRTTRNPGCVAHGFPTVRSALVAAEVARQDLPPPCMEGDKIEVKSALDAAHQDFEVVHGVLRVF